MQAPWLRSFARWLKRLLGLRSKEVTTIKILREYHAQNGSVSVFQLHDSAIPGLVDLWKIEKHKTGVGWFCLAVDLSQLRQDLSGTGLSLSAYFQNHHSSMAGQLHSQLENQSRFLATHYWICGTSKIITRIDRNGRSYKTKRIEGLTLIAGDYQGISAVFAGQKHIQRVNRTIVHQLANDEFRELKHHQDWQQAVCSINWVQHHEQILQSLVATDHRLQVPKLQRMTKASGDRS